MKKSGPKKVPFKEFFRNVKVIVGVLEGSAGAHYGYTISFEDVKEAMRRRANGEKWEPPLTTSEEERAALAKKPFTEFGSTFNSYEEVKEVARLLEERYGNTNPDREEAEKLIADLLAEVRSRK